MKVNTKHELGLMLAERRRGLEMTQQEFARHVGVPRLWIAQVETGKTNPTLSRLLDVLRRAGLTLSVDVLPEVKQRSDDADPMDRPPTSKRRVDIDQHLSRFADAQRRPA
jgi:transcriptional regulator with XRE-family HTH domain